MDRLRRLAIQWQMGFFALLMFAIAALVCAVLAVLAATALGVVVWLVAAALGWAPSTSYQLEQEGVSFLLWSAVIWLPLSAGIIFPDIARILSDRMRQVDDLKRKAEIAPYLPASR